MWGEQCDYFQNYFTNIYLLRSWSLNSSSACGTTKTRNPRRRNHQKKVDTKSVNWSVWADSLQYASPAPPPNCLPLALWSFCSVNTQIMTPSLSLSPRSESEKPKLQPPRGKRRKGSILAHDDEEIIAHRPIRFQGENKHIATPTLDAQDGCNFPKYCIVNIFCIYRVSVSSCPNFLRL